MRVSMRVVVLSLVGLLVGCGGGTEPGAGPEESGDDEAPVEVPAEEEEEKPSACLSNLRGPVVKLQAGKAKGDNFSRVTFVPHDLKLPADKFVTLKITNPSSTPHDFAAEDLDCQTEQFGTGESVSVSFKVPKGETDFVCTIHDAFMTGNIIGVKK
jgi:plastocyanin